MSRYAKIKGSILDKFQFELDGSGGNPNLLEYVRYIVFNRLNGAVVGYQTQHIYPDKETDHEFEIPNPYNIETPRVIMQTKFKHEDYCENFLIDYHVRLHMPEDIAVERNTKPLGRCPWGMCPELDSAIFLHGTKDWETDKCFVPEGL